MNISQQQMAAVFNEWARRYAENPDEFGDILDAEGKPVEDYGQSSAAYFEQLACELFADMEPAASPDVFVFSRDELVQEARWAYKAPWLAEEPDGTLHEFDNEHAARSFQRTWRIAHNLNPLTGEPV